ncbi:F0F1 ATP synthase [Streptococcus sanguinis SK150]|uniref:F0F1 ATP synthase n=1 Tax=Streptococcus sanguinis SK150 TaxID=888811 RepID=F0INS3_STRSA|nr:F0F1 ATP synthase [Streptococcus sanguinis SK150]
MLLVTNGLFVYQLFKLVQLDASVTAEEKEELETRKNACSIYWV